MNAMPSPPPPLPQGEGSEPLIELQDVKYRDFWHLSERGSLRLVPQFRAALGRGPR